MFKSLIFSVLITTTLNFGTAIAGDKNSGLQIQGFSREINLPEQYTMTLIGGRMVLSRSDDKMGSIFYGNKELLDGEDHMANEVIANAASKKKTQSETVYFAKYSINGDDVYSLLIIGHTSYLIVVETDKSFIDSLYSMFE